MSHEPYWLGRSLALLEWSCHRSIRHGKDVAGFKEVCAHESADHKRLGWGVETGRVSRGDERFPSNSTSWKVKMCAKPRVEFPLLKLDDDFRQDRKGTIFYTVKALVGTPVSKTVSAGRDQLPSRALAPPMICSEPPPENE